MKTNIRCECGCYMWSVTLCPWQWAAVVMGLIGVVGLFGRML